ncbi:MAG: tetratricopeptide repeat protein [Candidatus Poseidoniaceae archaeon]
MNECGVCGILYLAGGSCPACGSQIQKKSQDFQDAEMVLPTEVPGLDEAADAWYDLEGMERPVEEKEPEPSSSLPFGFGGESLTNVSRLPFGIGSHRDGIPFDVEHTTETNEDVPKPEPESPVVSADENAAEPVSIAPPVETEQDDPEEIVPSLPEVNLPTEEEVSPTPEPVRITAIPIMEATVAEAIPQIPLDTTSGEGIFAQDDDVIEVVFSDLEDTVVHVDHGVDDSFVQPQVVEYAEKTFTPFDLHPARAMTVQASNDESLKALVESGFVSIGQGDWRSAARSFQRVLASVPGDVGAMNNYGIALLQVATTMQESADPVDVSNAATQFEAAILSLREAVRANTDHPEPLYNLAQALLLSGREEKALGLVGMASETEKSKSHFVNLHAAILAQMGQYGEAKTMLASIQGEPLVSQNLLKLPSL